MGLSNWRSGFQLHPRLVHFVLRLLFYLTQALDASARKALGPIQVPIIVSWYFEGAYL
jgi:hypothetical protein